MAEKEIKKPNFFIIGAPKCGTTSLSEYLRLHPDIYFSQPKEPMYFSSDIPNTRVYRYTSLDDYLQKCFDGSSGYKFVGEGSTRYLTSEVAVPEILKMDPSAKFIVMLRNPVYLCHSLYYQYLKDDNEDAESFEKAWRLQDERNKGNDLPKRVECPALLQYRQRCMLGEQLERLFTQVSNPKQVLIISFNDFISDTEVVYKKVLNFLGADYDGQQEFPIHNEYGKIRSKFFERVLSIPKHSFLRPISKKLKKFLNIQHWAFFVWMNKMNYRKIKKEPMSKELREELTEYFRSDVEKVKRLTGIDLYEN